MHTDSTTRPRDTTSVQASVANMRLFALPLLTLPLAPPLTLPKYETLQSRRVTVLIEWGGNTDSAWRAAEARRIV